MDNDLTLDGNAIAGLLRDIFCHEVTAAAGCCARCGAVEVVARSAVYLHAPGTVVRCAHCHGVLVRVLQDGGRRRVDLRGLAWLELHEDGRGRGR